MSGSGGGYSGGGGTITDYVDFCVSVIINTQLSSPKDDVVSQLKIGDILPVVLHSIGGNQSLVVALHKGEIAGGITSPESNRLKECIVKSNNYTAEVTELNAGQVKVKIKWLSSKP